MYRKPHLITEKKWTCNTIMIVKLTLSKNQHRWFPKSWNYPLSSHPILKGWIFYCNNGILYPSYHWKMVILSLEHVDFITGKWWFYHWKMWILSLENVDFISLENGDFIIGTCGLYHWKMVILSLENVDFITGKWGFYHGNMGIII